MGPLSSSDDGKQLRNSSTQVSSRILHSPIELAFGPTSDKLDMWIGQSIGLNLHSSSFRF